MDLDRVAATLRPRRSWEGLDLGFVLGRTWFATLWPLWWIGALPAAPIAALLVGGRADWWLVILWWLKPAFEAPLVVWIGRALFGERVSLAGIRPVLRAAWSRRLLPFLLWRRLSPARSFVMPIALLEGLSGREARQRRRILSEGDGTAVWLTVVCYHFEAILWGGLLLTVVYLVPEGLPRLDLGAAVTESHSWAYWASGVFYVAAVSAIAPFYVAGGFALYLTRRTDLEAWDLDLAFRHPLGARAQGPGRGAGPEGRRPGTGTLTAALAPLALLAGLAIGLGPGEAAARGLPEPEQARALIAEVLADETFGRTRKTEVWVPIAREGEAAREATPGWLKGLADLVALVGPVLKWLLLTLAVAAVALLAWRVARDWRPRARLPRRPEAQRRGADTLVEPGQGLPADLAAAVRARLAAGDPRGALALLYRGGIAHLSELGVEIPPGATEGECLALAGRRLGMPALAPFRDLTRDWQALAYAHRAPSAETIVRRLDQWLAWTGAVAGAGSAAGTGGEPRPDPSRSAAQGSERET